MNGKTGVIIGTMMAYLVMAATILSGIIMLFFGMIHVAVVFLSFIPTFFALHLALLFGTGVIKDVKGWVMMPIFLGSVAVTLSSTISWWIDSGEIFGAVINSFVCLVLFSIAVFLGFFVVNIRSELKKLVTHPKQFLRFPGGWSQ